MRAAEWWEFKLVPIFAIFYATAFVLDVPISALWRTAILLLIALVPGAAYVSVINDLTDRREDAEAGKPNRLANASPLLAATLVSIAAGCGLAIAFLWRHDTLLLTTYLAAWLAFSLYSLPPFRFKTRGLAGVLCDAAGSNLFPMLVAVLLAFRAADELPRMEWLLAIGSWAMFFGIRGILWHQLTDLEHDRKSNVRTFAQRHRPEVSIAIGTWIVFPLELLALASMLWQIGHWLPVALLALHALIAVERRIKWRTHAVIVKPKPRFFLVLYEYYVVYLPLAILIASALQHSRDWLALVAHLLLFPAQFLRAMQEAVKAHRDPLHW